MTVVKIVDASALGAVLFAEPAGAGVVTRIRDASLSAPTLIGCELASVCLKKIRAHPEQRSEFLTAFASWTEMRIELFDVDFGGALSAAEQSGLTVYNASYLWLARHLNAELVTLDRELADAVAGRHSGG